MRKLLILLLVAGITLFAQRVPKTMSVEGITAEELSEKPASNSINVVETINGEIWLGSTRSLSVSNDNGATWKNYYGTDGFGTDDIAAIQYDPYDDIIWVSTANTVEQNGGNFPNGTGLHYTTDGGATWTHLPQPLDDENDTTVTYGDNVLRALPVTVTPNNLSYDIAVTPGAVWITSFAGMMRKSTDRGQTWQRVVLPPDYLDEISPEDELDFCLSPVAGNFCSEGNLNHRAFSVTAVDETTLYVGTASGINKSTDGGISWRHFTHQNQAQPIGGNFVVGLHYNQYSETIYAATWRADDTEEIYSLSFSTDGGESWGTTLHDERVNNIDSHDDIIIASANSGPFKAVAGDYSWVLPGSIVDYHNNNPILTTVFYDAGFTNDGLSAFLGSADGLVKYSGVGPGWSTNNWEVTIVSGPLESRDDSYAFPNPFNPRSDVLKIKYSTGDRAAAVTITIYDFGMNYIKTVVQNAPRNPVHVVDEASGGFNGVIDYWDGRDEYGQLVPNGVYLYRIEVEGEEPQFGKIMVVK